MTAEKIINPTKRPQLIVSSLNVGKAADLDDEDCVAWVEGVVDEADCVEDAWAHPMEPRK